MINPESSAAARFHTRYSGAYLHEFHPGQSCKLTFGCPPGPPSRARASQRMAWGPVRFMTAVSPVSSRSLAKACPFERLKEPIWALLAAVLGGRRRGEGCPGGRKSCLYRASEGSLPLS